MILEVEKFKDSCKKVLGAVETDSSLKNVIYGYDTLELDFSDGSLKLNVTNGEYYASLTIGATGDESLRAVVDAKLFLTLVAKITTKEMEVFIEGNALVVKANGTYKFPLKYDMESLVVLPKIELGEKVTDFVIDSSILLSILGNNTGILADDKSNRPMLEKTYYLDQEGCITFTRTTACVYSFTLPQPIKVLMSQKFVRLFKLFHEGDVKVSIGIVDVGANVQTRMLLEQEGLSVISILPGDQNTVSSVPVQVIRGRAKGVYKYSATFDKAYFMEAVDRLLLFDGQNPSLSRGVGEFDFDGEGASIKIVAGNGNEYVPYVTSSVTEPYKARLDLVHLREVLASAQVGNFTMRFGDDTAVVIVCGSVINVIGQTRGY